MKISSCIKLFAAIVMLAVHSKTVLLAEYVKITSSDVQKLNGRLFEHEVFARLTKVSDKINEANKEQKQQIKQQLQNVRDSLEESDQEIKDKINDLISTLSNNNSQTDTTDRDSHSKTHNNTEEQSYDTSSTSSTAVIQMSSAHESPIQSKDEKEKEELSNFIINSVAKQRAKYLRNANVCCGLLAKMTCIDDVLIPAITKDLILEMEDKDIEDKSISIDKQDILSLPMQYNQPTEILKKFNDTKTLSSMITHLKGLIQEIHNYCENYTPNHNDKYYI